MSYINVSENPDLTGYTIGVLSVIGRSNRTMDNRVLYKCKCSICGDIRVLTTQMLRNKKWKSKCDSETCRPDLVGLTFGKLIVLSFSRYENTHRFWLCQCQCVDKTEIIVNESNLKNGNTKSCGCTRFKDITGDMYGRWKVLQRVKDNKYSHASWICKCMKCGHETVSDGTRIRKGLSIKCNCPNNNKLPEGEARFNALYHMYSSSEFTRGLNFDIPKIIFRCLIKCRCYYCDREPYSQYEKDKSNGSFIYNGLDRVDNNIGYTIDNVVTCCKECNRMKGSMKHDLFVDLCNRISRHTTSSSV